MYEVNGQWTSVKVHTNNFLTLVNLKGTETFQLYDLVHNLSAHAMATLSALLATMPCYAVTWRFVSDRTSMFGL